jgi:LPXTG-motif cell wall-anchored protein
VFEVDVTIATTPSQQVTVQPQTKLFGGLTGPGSNIQGTFSGNAPTQPTLQTAPISHNIPTVSELNSPEAMVGIVLGDLPEGSSEPVSGFVDYLSIDVVYDDSTCFPALDPSTIAPPKTGAALTIFIISAGALSALSSSLITLRRRKKNRIQSERQ